ncbi:MAG: YggS family pyridoxal phosphate-dependent enzyme [Candidatus Amulumruptor caecigallinarius]|nr:YggS family pyridoxal phosphate-dependent enzyme [Candidatus Amulumruptor caecigallinarius]
MIADEIRKLHEELPADVQLVAVSKFHPAEMIREAYDAGQRYFGESRVQELLAKIPLLPDEIRWHFIGHLQTNKVRQLLQHVAMIESVDSEKLLNLIDVESCRLGVVTNVLMQVHVAREETKFGFLPEELLEYFKSRKYDTLKAVNIRGLMGMATNTDDMNTVRADFRKIHNLFHEISEIYKPANPDFNKISMGMSHDWPIAVEEGANIVRVGTRIFGERNY